MSDAGMNGSAAGPTIPASAETLLRFQPDKLPGQEERVDRPVYLLAAPTDKLRRAWHAACAARGLRHFTDADIASEIRVWLDDMREANAKNPELGITAEMFERHLGAIERFHERQPKLAQEIQEKMRDVAQGAEGKEKDAEAVKAVAGKLAEAATLSRADQLILDRYQQIRRIASEECERVRHLEAQRRRYADEYLKVAAIVALRGWEGIEGVVVVNGTEADAATMARIDEETQEAIGAFWRDQSNLTPDQKKTSDLPPPSPTIPTTTPQAGSEPPLAPVSRRSRATRSGTKSSASIPVG